MARITVEQIALTDIRYVHLGRLYKKDRRWALGTMIFIWNQCQELEKYCLTEQEISFIHPDLKRLPENLIEAGFVELQSDGTLYVRGTKGRIEWLQERRKDGKKGGRPHNPMVNPRVLRQNNPPALAPAPAPAPVIEEKETKEKQQSPGKPAPCVFKKPSLEEVKNYFTEKGTWIDPEAFFHFYESSGWKVGNKPMKNWHSALVTWEKRNPRPEGWTPPAPPKPKRSPEMQKDLDFMDDHANWETLYDLKKLQDKFTEKWGVRYDKV